MATARLEGLELGGTSSSMRDDTIDENNSANQDHNDAEDEDNVQNQDATETALNFRLIMEEYSLQTPWYKREWSEIGSTFAKNFLLGYFPTFTDLYSDVHLFFQYLLGTMYIKTVYTMDHKYVNSTNCSLDYETITNSWNGTNWITASIAYKYSCFEVDPIYAWVTFAFTFGLPGFFLIIFLAGELNTARRDSKRPTCIQILFLPIGIIIAIILTSIGMALYPVAILFCKFISVFHTGKEFKKLSTRLADLEGTYEATPQLCVQIFIFCSRGDRQFSPIQWFSLVTSAVALNLPAIERFNETKPPADGMKEEIFRIVQLLPLFLTTALFRILTIAIISVFLKWFAILIYVPVLLFFGYLLMCNRTCSNVWIAALPSAFKITNLSPKSKTVRELQEKWSYTEEEMEIIPIRYRQFHMAFWFIFNYIALITLFIVANSLTNVELSYIGHSWNDIPIFTNILMLNSLIGFTLACGLVSGILFYIQVDQGKGRNVLMLTEPEAATDTFA